MIKFPKHILFALATCLLSLGTQAETQWLDRIAAIVDEDIILASELQARVETVKGNIARSGQQGPEEEQLRKEVLDLLILESIQMQMANRVGLRIDDEQLNESVSRVAAKNNMTLSQFRQALLDSGASYRAVREQIRREMILQRVQMGNVNQRIQISDQEVKNYLESEEGRARTAPEYHFAHVLIPVDSDASESERAKAEQKALAIRARLKRGDKYSAITTPGVDTSDLGWRRETDLPSLFAKVAPTMRDGDVSEPLKSASGFHVIQLLESRGLNELVAQTRASHILLKPSAIRSEAETRALAEKLRRRALNGESFRDLAKEYSEDIGSAQEGGDLGWTSPGQLVPEFQEAMDNADIGTITEPVQSAYGWHIIKVVERRQHDVSDQLRERMARNVLHERKYQDELDIWLRKIRSEAYVDIKI
ncbi:molecular chaperone SurA [Spongiibacter sp. KMU-166]|uniref:Chaperone SurA n=1 Tax=Spongiibacter thalassae TaxID=2721624 RepID=A0ABX1GBU3_9GAMM|nr:peptidylprolyl isomerase [Spongiibacter thalassae]NKI16625.1 molecular chaperone SurA [Spongiibacter thalassae]